MPLPTASRSTSSSRPTPPRSTSTTSRASSRARRDASSRSPRSRAHRVSPPRVSVAVTARGPVTVLGASGTAPAPCAQRTPRQLRETSPVRTPTGRPGTTRAMLVPRAAATAAVDVPEAPRVGRARRATDRLAPTCCTEHHSRFGSGAFRCKRSVLSGQATTTTVVPTGAKSHSALASGRACRMQPLDCGVPSSARVCRRRPSLTGMSWKPIAARLPWVKRTM